MIEWEPINGGPQDNEVSLNFLCPLNRGWAGPMGRGGGEVAEYMMGGGSARVSYCEPKKIHEPEILHPAKNNGIKISPKIQDSDTSILIFSIDQTKILLGDV